MRDGANTLQPEGITPLTSSLVEPMLPESITWVPNAPGWYVVLVIIAAYCVLKLYKRYQQYQKDAYRREALKSLASINLDSNDLRKLPLLLRRTALYAYPREEITPLLGASWEIWLDAQCTNSHFNTQHAGLLASLAYSNNPRWEMQQLTLLSDAIGHWIQHHEARND